LYEPGFLVDCFTLTMLQSTPARPAQVAM